MSSLSVTFLIVLLASVALSAVVAKFSYPSLSKKFSRKKALLITIGLSAFALVLLIALFVAIFFRGSA